MQIIIKTLITTLLLTAITLKSNAQDSDLPFGGGIGSGFANGAGMASLCAIGGNINVFSGGIAHGFSSAGIFVSNCEVVITISPFQGSIGSGYANAMLSEENCKSVSGFNLYSGGDRNGFAHFSRIYWNCDGENSTIINVNPLDVCQGDSILITGTLLSAVEYVEFAGAYTNQFSIIDSSQIRSIVPIGAQSGSVTVTGPNGTISSQQQLTITNIPLGSFTYEQINDLTFQFNTTNTSNTNHLWEFGDGNSSMQQNPLHTYSEEGIYAVTLLVDNICGENQADTNITAVHTGSMMPGKSSFLIFPNPFNDSFTLKVEQDQNDNVNIKIYNITGKLIYQDQVNNQREFSKFIDLSQFANGFYVVEIVSGNNRINKKIVKNR